MKWGYNSETELEQLTDESALDCIRMVGKVYRVQAHK